MAVLTRYRWPGNVRELMNVIERTVLLSDGPLIRPEHLPLTVAGPLSGVVSQLSDLGDLEEGTAPPGWNTQTWDEVRSGVLAATERAYLVFQLEATGGRVGETARRAGISPRSLYGKMRKHGLRKEDFRAGARRAS
jgi:DNA-binding NtrC family response regulator